MTNILRTIITLLCLEVFFLDSKAQLPITRESNIPLAGDRIAYKLVDGTISEFKGDSVLWDFSNLHIGKRCKPIRFATDTLSIRSVEPGVRRFYHVKEDAILLRGVQSTLDSIIYSESQVVMKYPFNYGDSISSSFCGQGKYCETYNMTEYGTLTVVADARGRILLPNGMELTNVLQLHCILRKTQQFENHGSAQADTTAIKQEINETFYWYSPYCRYPVFAHQTYTCYADNTPVSSQSQAFCYLPDSVMEKLICDDIKKCERAYSHRETSFVEGKGNVEDIPFSYHVQQSGNVVKLNSFRSSIDTNVRFIVASTMGVTYQAKNINCQLGKTYELTFDCAGYPPGNYLIYINANGIVVSEKFHKN